MTGQIRTQKGISFLGLVFVLIVLAFAGLFGLKLFPIYMTSFKFNKAITAVVEDSSLHDQSIRAISRSLVKRLDIDSVYMVTEKNVHEFVTIEKVDGGISIDLYYDQEAALFGNIYLRVEFDKHFESPDG